MKNKNIKIYEYELPMVVSAQKEGGFLAISKSLQGVLAEGDTISEATANAVDIAKNIIDIMKENNQKVPLKIIKRDNFQTKVSILAIA